MSKKATPTTKPKEILELEQIYGVEFDVKDESFLPTANGAIIDTESGEVISIGITGAQNIEPLVRLKSLKTLTILGQPERDLAPIHEFQFLESLRINGFTGDHLHLLHGVRLKDITLGCVHQLLRTDAFEGLEYLSELTIVDADLADLSSLKNLKNLRSLRLFSCEVQDWRLLMELSKLTGLLIFQSGLTHTEMFRNLNAPLEFLSLLANEITGIDALSGLTSMRYLQLNSNRISELSPLSNLKKLQSLNIDRNEVSDLTPLLALPALELLSFDDNKVSKIPEVFFERGIFLEWKDNPIVEPDPAVLEQGREAVLRWFEEQRKGTVPLNELRVMLIGHGEAGKTSLMRRLTTDDFDKDERSTHGINMVKWAVERDGRNVRVNLWDFGGQQMQHSVHKFFLSHACLYILVSDNRKEDDPQYWLEHIHTLAKDAPVLVVYNKMDENPEEVFSQKALKDRYPNIIGFHKVSCLRGNGISELREHLIGKVMASEDASRPYPKSYFSVKQKLEQTMDSGRHHIDIKVYRNLCKEAGIKDLKAQRILLDLLNAIGTISFFDDADLKSLQVLNPEWVSDGVYRIITHDRVGKRRGDITMNDFRALLQPERPTDYTYDRSHYQYLLALMRKFELCHVREEDGHILIPARFSTEPKADYADYRGAFSRLYFFYYKSFLPVSIIHRFIARHIAYALGQDYWYRGIVLKDPTSATEAFVELNEKERRISLWIKGEDVVGYWGYLRRQIKELSDFFEGIEYDQYVAIDPENRGTRWLKYSNLTNALKNGHPKYYDPTLGTEVDVVKYLGYFGETPSTTMSGLEAVIGLNEYFGELRRHPVFINAPQFHQTQSQTQHVQVTVIQKLSDGIIGKLNALLEQEQSEEARNRLEQVIKATEELEKIGDPRNARRSGLLDRYTSFLNRLKHGGEWVNTIHDAYNNLPELAEQMGELIKQFVS